jgi:6-phosphogluconolactonase
MSSIIRPSIHLRQQCRWLRYPSTITLENAAAQAIYNASVKAIRQRGKFYIVLAGGTTPRGVYEVLRNMDANWNAWYVYFGDERCLPTDSPERNSLMASQSFLAHVDIPANQVNIMPAELGAQAAANAYAETIVNIKNFDLVLLGLGEDGHTASLFPDHYWGIEDNAPDTLAIFDAPKLPLQRVSLSAHRLSLTRQLIFLVNGRGKEQAISDWKNGKEIPAAAITPKGEVEIYLNENITSVK